MFFDGYIKKRALRLVPLGLTMFIIPHSLVAATSSGAKGAGLGESMRSLAISHDVSRWEYLITEFRVIVTYFRLLIYPVDQNLYYDYPVYRSLFIPEVLMSLFLLLMIASLAVYSLFRSLNDQSKNRHGLRLLAFGIIWFFTTLSIESSIVPIRDVIFEHRVYLPSVGIFLAFSVAVLLLASHLNTSSVSAGGAAMAILLPIVLVLSAVSYARNGVWQTEISLWEDVVKKSPAVGHNHTQLAIAYDEDGRTEDAMRAYKNAIVLDPLQAVARNNLGLHYVRLGRIEEGIHEYHETIRISPKDHMAYINLGVAYYTLRRDKDAIREYRRALQLEPADPITHYNLGLTYERAGRAEEAIREYQGAIEHNRDFLEAYFRLGETSYALERFEDAQRAFQSALERDPNHVGARRGLDRSIQMER
jgi:Flp pilus assembly protein TadD